ncbi:ABC transporter ATP-binding protein [Tunicatimonas pelagia]|uniref:ABC transporter ATP-binding protein n=1 Tax=Tunicatimonas pelagia TaxID=931531 RepID=UPI0026663ECB|nr:ABC transporter ATP-binding protein [Tunicatimonas pelagia]WKN42978.1 ABC transporter ATP-binding protein [Tunicatimonas pelagia]
MEKKKKDGIARLLEIAGRKKYQLALSGLLAVLHAALALVPYVLVYYILRELVNPPLDTELVQRYLGWAIAAGVGSYALLYASGMTSHVAAFNILYELRQQTAAKLGQLPLGFIGTYSSGTLKKIVADDIERIENFIAHQIPDFVKGFTLPVVTIGYLFYVDWRLAAISFVPLLVLAVWMPLMFRSAYTKEMMKKHHQAQEDMNSGIVEFVRAMPVMKIFAQTADSFRQYSGSVNEYDTMAKRWMRKSSPPFAVFMSFMSNATLPVLVLGTYLYLQDGITFATLVLFLILGVGYIKPMFALANMGMQITLINRGVQRMDDILQHPVQSGSKEATHFSDHSIEFRHVSFAYAEEVKVLDDVSFTMPAGTITALVGPSGAGKSTTAQLVARFWDVQEGKVLIGGIDIQTIPVATLMQQVSFVFQDSFMFQETMYENIRMGLDKSEAEVIAAAEAAQCHTFISQLPQGYQTRFGAQGVHLSGGEQQRIQLARAILKDAPILILDEATAFSDPENEYLIQQAFGRLIQDKTVIIIAHRLSTITDADQIVVFDQGRVAAKGAYPELLTQSKLYAQMWNAHVRAQEFSL